MRTRPGVAGRLLLLATLCALGAGCSSFRPREITPNPTVVRTTDFDAVWGALVRAIDEDFEIVEENRLARRIVTDPVTAATIFEPWRGDSVGLDQRLEATLQTYRRFAEAEVRPAPSGGYRVGVKVYKELEHLIKPERQMGGLAAFPQDVPVDRSREIVGSVPAPLGWIPAGRDSALEQRILRRFRDELFEGSVAY